MLYAYWIYIENLLFCIKTNFYNKKNYSNNNNISYLVFSLHDFITSVQSWLFWFVSNSSWCLKWKILCLGLPLIFFQVHTFKISSFFYTFQLIRTFYLILNYCIHNYIQIRWTWKSFARKRLKKSKNKKNITCHLYRKRNHCKKT